MKTRRMLALIVTIAMLFSMMGPSMAMAEEQLLRDIVDIDVQPEGNSEAVELDDIADPDLSDPSGDGGSLDLNLDLGALVTEQGALHTVRFDTRGGLPQPDPQTVEDGFYVQQPENPVLEGFEFTGWFLGEEEYFVEGLPKPVYGDLTLVAGWRTVEQPEAVEAQPEATEEQTEVGEEQPEVTEAQPEVVEAEPEVVEAQPEVVEAQPEATEEQPEATEEQPEATEEQPEATEEQPEATEEQPEAVEEQPEAVEEQPEATEEQPEATEEQPEATEEQPEAVEEQPEAVEEQPEVTIEESDVIIEESEVTGEQPEATEEAQVEVEEGQPDEALEQPAEDEQASEPAEAPAEQTEVSYPAFDQYEYVGDVRVTVRAAEGVFPEGALLSVEAAPEAAVSDIDAAVESERDENRNVAASYAFDIKVVDADGNEIQPTDGEKVRVSFSMREVSSRNLTTEVYHVTEDEATGEMTAQSLDVVKSGRTATAETEGFSYYQVEFTYDTNEYVLPGDETVALSEILSTVGLVGAVTAVEVSNPDLFSAYQEDGKWFVSANQPFTSTEWMKVTIGSVVYDIVVTDAIIWTVVFDSNGGSAVPNQMVSNKNKVTKPNDPVWPVKNTKSFKEWQKDGSAFSFDTEITSDTTLVAAWDNLIKVTFHSEYHTTDSTIYVIENAFATPPTLTKDGYVLTEWQLNGKKFEFNSTPITEPITLNAKWEKDDWTASALTEGAVYSSDTKTISFGQGHTSGEETAVDTLNYGKSVDETIKQDYWLEFNVFAPYTVAQGDTDDIEFNINDTGWYPFSALAPEWKDNHYVVTISQQVKAADLLENLDAVSKKPIEVTYAFARKDNDHAGAQTITVKLYPQNIELLNNNVRELKIADWKQIHTVTFKDGDKTFLPNTEVPNNTAISEPADKPTKEDKIFKEWQLNGASYDFEMPVTSSITLTAAWDDAVATIKVGDTTTPYGTLAEAFAAITDGTATTIEVLKDSKGAGIVVPSGRNITVNFNGHSYTVDKGPGAGSTGTENQVFQLIKDSTVVFNNGKIAVGEENATLNTYYRVIQNYANLTLNNMEVSGANLKTFAGFTNSVIESDNGTVNLVGSTKIADVGEIKAMNVDAWNGAYPDGTRVTINLNNEGAIGTIHCFTEGTGTAAKSSLNIEAGKVNALTIAEGNTVEVTKKTETPAAPEGYAWVKKNDTESILKQVFTVTFDAENGTEAVKVEVVDGDMVTKLEPNPTKANFVFDNWYKVISENTTEDTAFDFKNTPITANITLKAKWSTAVASITKGELAETTYYATLQDAVNAAENGDTIKLLTDIADIYDPVDVSISGKSITLDMNNANIGDLSPRVRFTIDYGATLTITDSSEESEGQIYIPETVEGVTSGFFVSGTLVLGKNQGVQIINAGENVTLITVNDGGKLIVNDGCIDPISNGCVGIANSGTVEISGGQFNGYPADEEKEGSVFVKQVSDAAKTSISDGEFDDNELYSGDSEKISISGGTFLAPVPVDYCAQGYIPVENEGTYTVGEGWKVSFNTNGSPTEVDTQPVQNGGYANEPTAPTWENYGKFLGWYAPGETEGTLQDTPFDFEHTPITADITLTAKWAEWVASVTHGEEVTYYATLQDAVNAAHASDTIKLLEDVFLAAAIDVDKKVTLDLNGKTITNASGFIADYLIGVKRGGDLTIEDSSKPSTGAITSTDVMCGIKMTLKGEATTGTPATLTVNSGSITGHDYGISGNGNRHDTEITVKGGTITGTNGTGIYQPQDGTLDISGGTFIGKDTGIEVRSGTLNVTGGTFETKTTEFSCNPNGNGTTTKGAAIAIAQHTTLKQINATITGATFTVPGGTAVKVSVQNPQNNSFENVEVQSSVTDGSNIPEGYCWAKADETSELYTLTKAVASVTSAGVTTNYPTLQDAIAAAQAGDTVKLLADVNLTEQLGITNAVTLDLNGKKIEYTGSATLSSGVIMVHRGGHLTVDDTTEDKLGAIKSGEKAYAGIALTHVNDAGSDKAELTVKAGNVEGYYYAITGNGNRHGTAITVTGGTLEGKNGTAIYQPQDGTLDISGGTFIGKDTGIEVRSGTLNVTGGTFETKTSVFSCDPNGNGTTTEGAAIAIAQHTTRKRIKATIKGATFTVPQGTAVSVAVQNPQGNTFENVEVQSSVKDDSAIPEGYCWAKADETSGLYTLTKAVASVTTAAGVTTNYPTFDAAIRAAREAIGSTLTLLENVNSEAYYGIKNSFTIDLNGKTLTAKDSGSLFLVWKGATLTINGTTENSTVVGRINVGSNANDNGNLTLNGGSYTCSNGDTVVHVHGECKNSNVTINGATITSPDDNGIQLNGAGNHTITNSTISGETAVYLKAGTLTVTGSTLKSTAASHTDYKFNGNGSNPTGDAIVVDSCAYPGGNPTLKLGDCNTFTVENNSNVQIGYYEANTDKDGYQSGIVNATTNALSTVPTYFWKNDGNNNYTLTKAAAYLNDIPYANVQAAVDAWVSSENSHTPYSETLKVVKGNDVVVIESENSADANDIEYKKVDSAKIVGIINDALKKDGQDVVSPTRVVFKVIAELETGTTTFDVNFYAVSYNDSTELSRREIVTDGAGKEIVADAKFQVKLPVVESLVGQTKITVIHNTDEGTLIENFPNLTVNEGYVTVENIKHFSKMVEQGESVAMIATESETRYFTSLAEAITAAAEGQTVTLLADINVANTAAKNNGIYNINKAITIDGDGKKITVISGTAGTGHVFNVMANGVTIKNLTVDGDGKDQHAIHVYKATGVVLDKLTLTGNQLAVCVNGSSVTATDIKASGNTWGGINVDARNGEASLTVGQSTNGTTNIAGTTEAPWAAVYVDSNATNASTVTINGGTLTGTGVNGDAINNDVIKSTSNTLPLSDGLAWQDLGNNTYKAVKAVASITKGTPAVTTYYATLQEAVNAAADGDTVKLLKDLKDSDALTARVDVNASGKAITVDLNGKDIVVTHTSGNGSAFNIVSGTMTITNSVVNDVSDIDGTGVKEVPGNTTANAVGTNDGICLVTVRDDATLNLNGNIKLTVNSKNGSCVYPFEGGTVYISGGTYENGTEEQYQYNPDFKAMTVNQANVSTQLIHITGGTFKGQDPQVGDDSTQTKRFVEADYVAMPANGTTIGQKGTYNVEPGHVVTFDTTEGAIPATIVEQRIAENGTATKPTDPTKANYVFGGWYNGDTEWQFDTDTVTTDITLKAKWTTAVASITKGEVTTYYATLQEAVNAAADGDTVKLLKDLKDSDALTARVDVNASGKAITVDLNGKDIVVTHTSGNGSAFNIVSGTMTITNSVENDVSNIDGTGVSEVPGNTTANAVGTNDGICLVTVRNGATLNLADGINMVVDSKNGSCVYPFAGGKVNITGGTYENRTTEDYQYKAGFKGMTINQANNAGQLINITGGTFIGNDPQLGDDSNGARFVTLGNVAMPAEGTTATQNGTYNVVLGGRVTFDVDGGTPAPVEQRIAKGNNATKPTDPTKANYVFGGWYNGDKEWKFDTVTVTTDITLKAQWTTAVASITKGESAVTTYYATLQDAVNAANGDTVKLLADIEVGATILAGKTVTIDLNDKSIITATGDALLNKGTLTVVGEGTVTTTAAESAAVANVPGGVVTLKGGNYYSDNWYTIKNLGKMTIDGPVTVAKTEGNTNTASMIDNGWYGSNDKVGGENYPAQADKASLEIRSGTFTGEGGAKSCSVVKNDDYGTLTISGGKFDSTNNKGSSDAATLLNYGTANVSGGSFVGMYPIANGYYGNAADPCVLNITGGTFKSVSDDGVLLGAGSGNNTNPSGKLSITGGTFIGDMGVGSKYPVEISNPTTGDGPLFTKTVTPDYVKEDNLCTTTLKKKNVDGEEYYYIVKAVNVIFDANGGFFGGEPTKTIQVPKGEKIVDSKDGMPADPTYSDKTKAFDGWYNDRDCTEKATIKAEINNQTTVYAKWSESVAEIDGVYYPTLAVAFDAAQAGNTIVLLNDIELPRLLKNEKNVTLNLNGHTIEEAGSRYIHNNGTLTLVDNVGDGGIVGTTYGIFNAGTLNIVSGNIAASKYGVSQNSADAVTNITGGIITAQTAVNAKAGTVEASGKPYILGTKSDVQATNAKLSGGYYTHKVPASYIVAGKTCTTKPNDEGYYEIVDEITVTFDPQDGTFEDESLTIEEGKAVMKGAVGETITLPVVTKNGTTFLGWSYGNKTYAAGYEFKLEADGDNKTIAMAASWNEVHTVTFYEDATKTEKVEHGKTVTEPVLAEKEGYTFDGWYKGNEKFDFATPVTTDIELTAKWKINQYTITFDTDGGSAVEKQVVDYKQTATKPNTDPTKAGFVFGGWQLNGSDYDFNNEVTADITLKAKWTTAVAKIGDTYYTTLAAAVAAAQNEDTVELIANIDALDERVDVNKSITIDLGGHTIKPTNASKNGSAFDITAGTVEIKNGTLDGTGVEESENGNVKIANGICLVTVRNGATLNLADGITMTVNSKNGSCVYPFAGGKVNITGGAYENKTTEDYQYKAGFKGLTVNQANGEQQLISITGGTFIGNDPQLGDDSGSAETFTAEGYVAIEQTAGTFKVVEGYNVVFEADGGEPEAEDQRIEKGAKVTKPEDPAKLDKDFEGWFAVESAKDAIPDSATAFDFGIAPEEDIILKAKWKLTAYTITYDLDGGEVAGENKNPDTYTTESETFTLTNPTKAGYVFAGWTGTGLTEATETVIIEKGSTGDREYKAKWTPITYTIVFNKNDAAATGDMDDYIATYDVEPVIVNGFEKDNYTFAGWAKTATGTVESSLKNLTTEAGGKVELFAIWTQNDFVDVAYNANNVTEPATIIQTPVYVNVATALYGKDTEGMFTRKGYTLTGWNTRANGRGTYYELGETVELEKNLTLYAEWTITKAEAARQAFDKFVKNGVYTGDWATLIKAAYTYIGHESDIAVPNYYATITGIDMSGKDITSNGYYSIDEGEKWDVGSLTIFTGLKDLNLANTNVQDLGGIAGLTDIEKLDISGLSDVDNLGALANLKDIKDLDVSATGISDLNVLALLNGPVEKITAKGLTLDSIAGAVVLGNENKYADGANVDMGDSTLLGGDPDDHVGMIKAKLDGNFIPPYVPVTVTFDSDGGTDVKAQEVNKGTTASEPEVPTKKGYTLDGWYDDETEWKFDSDKVKADTTLTAKWTAIQYTITFVDEDGNELSTAEYDYGTVADDIVEPTAPTKAADDEYTYTFAGWTPKIVAVTGDATYKATYTTAENTAVAKDDQGNYYNTLVEAVSAVKNGTITLLKDAEGAGIFVGAKDGKDITIDFDGHTYTCSGPAVGSAGTQTQAFHLEKDNTIVLKNGTIKNTEDANVKMLVQNYSNLTLDNMKLDGTKLPDSGRYVLSTNNGETVIKDTVITAKAGDIAFDVCSFGSYTGNKVTVTGDSVITGDVEISSSNVPAAGLTLNLEGGKLTGKLVNAGIAEGTDVNGTKTNAEFSQGAPKGYVWQDQNNGTSKLVKLYTIKFVNDDGAELQSSEVAEGETPAYTGETPTKAATAQYSYTFKGWTPEIVAVTGEATYTATYTETVNQYTVKFVDEDGTELSTAKYAYGTAAADIAKPADPTKAAEGTKTYAFVDWDPEIAEVTADATYKATYEETENVAKIGDTYYATLAEAIDKAENGDTVTLLTNIALTETQEIKKDTTTDLDQAGVLTIDLNGKNITATDARALWVKSGNVTIRGNGTISANGEGLKESGSVIRVGDSEQNGSRAWLTVGEGVTVTSGRSYGITAFGKNSGGIYLDVEGVVAVTGNSSAISNNGSSGLTNTNMVINGMVTAANDYAIYHPGNGTLSIGGEVKGLGGIEIKSGEATIFSGATITATALQQSHTTNNNGTSTSGYAIAAISNANYVGEPSVAINTEAISGKTVILADNNADAPTGTVTATVELPTDDNEMWVASDDQAHPYKLVEAVTVTFDMNGATSEAIEAQKIQKGKTADKPDDPTKENYDFGGWFVVEKAEDAIEDDATAFEFTTVIEADTILKAKWTAKQYEIKFVNDGYDPENPDETLVLQSGKVAYGKMPVYEGEPPIKAKTAEKTYTFAGWTPEIVAVTGEATYTATYTETVNKYTITFVNDDNTELQSGEVAYGETPTYDFNKGIPTKEANGNTYTFAGWDPAITTVTGEAIYKATYNGEPNTFTIKFVDEDGSLYDVITEKYGTEITVPVVTKNGHEFLGWKAEGTEEIEALPKTMPMPAENVTYIAQWAKSTWTVETITANGTVDENVVTFSGATVGFSPANADIGRNIDGYWVGVKFHAPEFITKDNIADVQYSNNGGETWNSFNNAKDSGESYPAYMEAWVPIAADNVPEQLAAWAEAGYTKFSFTYMFDNNGGDDHSDAQSFTIIYKFDNLTLTKDAATDPEIQIVNGEVVDMNTNFEVKFVDEDGETELAEAQTVRYNATATEPDPAPTKEGYTFDGWQLKGEDYDFSEGVKANTTLTASWTVNQYTIKFVDEDGTELSTAKYDYGTAAADIVKPADPTKAAEGTKTYTFVDWDPAIAEVTGDATYKATYTPTENVARIGETYYESLEKAFEAADYDIIDLLVDTKIDSITVDTDVTLNLNGHEVSSDAPNLFYVTKEGDLTIHGRNENGIGKITGPKNGKNFDGKALITVDGGHLYINGGELTATGEGSDGMYGVYVLNGGMAIFREPTITSHFAAIGTNNTTAPATIIVNGGTYTAEAMPTNNEWWSYFCAPIYAASSGSYDIKDGTFKGYYGISSRYANVEQTITLGNVIFDSASETNVFVDEKTGTGDANAKERYVWSTDNEKTVPEGYTWVQNGDRYLLAKLYTVTFKSEGEVYATQTIPEGETVDAPEDEPTTEAVKVFGGWTTDGKTLFDFNTKLYEDTTIDAMWLEPVASVVTSGDKTTYFLSLAEAVDAAKYGDTIKMLADDTLYGDIVIDKAVSIDFNGFTVNEGTSSIVNNDTLNLMDTSDGDEAGGLVGSNYCIDNNGTLNISGGELYGTKYGIYQANGEAETYMDGGVLSSNKSAIYAKAGTVYIDSDATIIGSMKDVTATGTAKVEVSGGWFSKKVPANQCAEDYKPTEAREDAPNAYAPYTVEDKYEAEIEGKQKYETFAEAADAAEAGDVISLLKDVEEPYQLSETNDQLKVETGGYAVEITAPAGKVVKTETDEQTGITTYELADAEASITKGEPPVTKDYETFAEAAQAAVDGDVIKLLKDAEEPYELAEDETLRVEKDGKKVEITAPAGKAVSESTTGDVTTYTLVDAEASITKGEPEETTYYATFTEAALEAEDDDVVKLLKDAEESYQMSDGEILKVEKDGHDVTVNGAVATTEGGLPVVTTYYADFADAAENVGLLDVITLVDDNPEPYTLGEDQTLKIKAGDFDPNLVAPVGKVLKSETDENGITTYSLEDADYTITYVLNGGTNDPTNPTGYSAGMAEAIVLKDATREYYDFAGWYYDEELTTKVEEIAVGRTGNITLYAKWEDTVTFLTTLNMADYTGIYVYIHIPDGEDPDAYTVQREYQSQYKQFSDATVLSKLPYSVRARGNEMVSFYQMDLLHAASPEMSDVATIKLLKNSDIVKTENYSVRSIVEERIASGELDSVRTKLHWALVQYGYYAQLRFGNKTDDLPDISGAPALVQIPDSYAAKDDPTNFGNYISKFEAKIDMDSAIGMNVYLTPAQGYGIDDFVISITDKKGATYTQFTKPEMSGNRIYFKVQGIASPQLGNDYQINVRLKNDATKSATWKRSVITCAYENYQGANGNQNRMNLMMALYQYYLAAAERWPNQ